jgi:FkbM family methyltransferase
VDIGAAAIAETPPYKPLLDMGLARLSAFEGDERQISKLVESFGPEIDVYPWVIADGQPHTMYLTSPVAGMSSLLRPSKERLSYFNGFETFGEVQREVEVATRRLDDLHELHPIDFLKMDVQGAELMVLEHGAGKLADCVAIQLEVSFVPLYEDQPGFGEIDVLLRRRGFLPHCFVDVKRWSIAPTLRDGDFRRPFNQLLEADIVYVRDPRTFEDLSGTQLTKLAHVALLCYRSPDLAAHLLAILQQRGEAPRGLSIAAVAQRS